MLQVLRRSTLIDESDVKGYVSFLGGNLRRKARFTQIKEWA
jgi:hypothetical protein